MKKIISLLLTVLLVFAGVSTLAEDDVTGTWYAATYATEGITLDTAAIGFDMTVTLDADGTYSVSSGEETASGTWTVEGNTVTAVAGGDTTVYEYDGTNLSWATDGVTVTFTRENTASDGFTEIYAEDIAAFDGAWFPTQFGIYGYYVTADALSSFGIDASVFESLSFTISGGVVTADGEDVPFELVDGLLFCEIEGIEGSFRIQLLEGDMIMIDMPTLPVTLICSRAAAAADEAASAGTAA